MAASRDFTDYVVMVFDSGERVYHLGHIQSFKGKNAGGKEIQGTPYPFGGHKYLLNLDRAYRIKWAPWKKIAWKHPRQTFKELLRSKKIGLLLYQEPCNNNCSKCPDEDGTKCKSIPDLIEPMHVSRIHQPSGVMKG